MSATTSNGKWHHVTGIDEATFCITQPLGALEPSFGVATANMYLLLGETGAALIDTGVGIGDLGHVIASLTALPCIALNTHYHWDHSGSNLALAESAIHEQEAGELAHGEEMGWLVKKWDTPEAREVLPEGFDPASYRIPPRPPTRLLRDGDIIDLGGREIVALHTPGHSPGHTVFLDRANGLLFTGDLAYQGPIYVCFGESDPTAFISSAQRLAQLDQVTGLYPGHNAPIADPGFLGRVADAAQQALADPAGGAHRQKPFRGREHAFQGFSLWMPSHGP